MVDAPCDLGLEEPREGGLETPDTNEVGLMNIGEYKGKSSGDSSSPLLHRIVGEEEGVSSVRCYLEDEKGNKKACPQDAD
jgi:hypothetical protein